MSSFHIRHLGLKQDRRIARGFLGSFCFFESFLRDPQNQCGAMPFKLPVSHEHTRNFVDAIKRGTRAICDIQAAVRADTLCQLALIAVKQGHKLHWDPQSERFPNDDFANAMLQPRAFRGEWKLPPA